jgi:hypothetical protein
MLPSRTPLGNLMERFPVSHFFMKLYRQKSTAYIFFNLTLNSQLSGIGTDAEMEAWPAGGQRHVSNAF